MMIQPSRSFVSVVGYARTLVKKINVKGVKLF